MRIIIILMAPQRNVLKFLLAAGYSSYNFIPVWNKIIICKNHRATKKIGEKKTKIIIIVYVALNVENLKLTLYTFIVYRKRCGTQKHYVFHTKLYNNIYLFVFLQYSRAKF